jgi:hypothetical protein
VNYSNPTIVIGLLLMGMAVGAMLTREFFRRNLRSIVDDEIDRQCRSRALTSHHADLSSEPTAQPLPYQAVRSQEGASGAMRNYGDTHPFAETF